MRVDVQRQRPVTHVGAEAEVRYVLSNLQAGAPQRMVLLRCRPWACCAYATLPALTVMCTSQRLEHCVTSKAHGMPSMACRQGRARSRAWIGLQAYVTGTMCSWRACRASSALSAALEAAYEALPPLASAAASSWA